MISSQIRTNNMNDFLLYDVLSPLIEALPAVAVSLLAGHYVTNRLLRDRIKGKTQRRLIVVVVALAVFLVLRSLML